jgi:enolase
LDRSVSAESEDRKSTADLMTLDSNKEKIAPDVVNISRSQFKTMSEMIDFFRLIKNTYPPEIQFSFVINDNKFDVNNGAIVDVAVGLGCEYLNIKGFFRPEKIAKIFRYAEIVQESRQ